MTEIKEKTLFVDEPTGISYFSLLRLSTEEIAGCIEAAALLREQRTAKCHVKRVRKPKPSKGVGRGGHCTKARAVIVNGIRYKSISKAANANDVYASDIQRLIELPNFDGHYE